MPPRKERAIDRGVETPAERGGVPGRLSAHARTAWILVACFLPAMVTVAAVSAFAGYPWAAPAAMVAATLSCTVVAAFVTSTMAQPSAATRRAEADLREGLRRAEGEISRLERMAMLGEALVAVAHDINNPLTAILGFCEMALASPSLDGEARSHMEVVRSQAERCRRLVHALLPFSRESHDESEPTAVNDLVASVLQLREFSFRSAGIRAETVSSPSSPVVRVPAAEAQLAILNLVVNAEQALANIEGPRAIRIRTAVEGERAIISVEDNGPGVPMVDRDRIFESFYTTKPAGVGTGIGLTNARRAAERWGGSLVCEPGVPSGAKFVLSWPLSPAAAAASAPSPMPDVSGLKILAVDDEQFMLNFYRASLSRRGCMVRGYRRAAEALPELQREIPDVLLMDWVRPEEVTALTLRRLFGEIPELRRRTVVVTGEPIRPEAASGLPVISKPFGLRELVEMIGRVAGRVVEPQGGPDGARSEGGAGLGGEGKRADERENGGGRRNAASGERLLEYEETARS